LFLEHIPKLKNPKHLKILGRFFYECNSSVCREQKACFRPLFGARSPQGAKVLPCCSLQKNSPAWRIGPSNAGSGKQSGKLLPQQALSIPSPFGQL
jgi:hypothetical protein